MYRRILVVLGLSAAALVAGALAAQAGGGGCRNLTEARTTEIAVRHNCFDAGIAYVEVGDTVTWTNHDEWSHNIAAANFTGTHDLSSPFAWTFVQEGIYPYTCTLHWGMVGAVVVGEIDPLAVDARTASPSVEADGSDGALPVALAMGAGLGLVVIGVRRFTRRIDAG